MTGRCASLLAASVALISTMPSSIGAAEASSCKMGQITELPVRFIHNKLIVDGAINGQKVGIMLDTGSGITVILRPAAIRLGLSRQKASGYRMFGIGGESDAESAQVDEFKIGQATVKGRRMLVAGEYEIGDDIAVILGEDFFHQVDVEFDLAHNAVRLFQPKDCDRASLAYWATNGASEVAFETIDNARPRIVLPSRCSINPKQRGWVSRPMRQQQEAVVMGSAPSRSIGQSTQCRTSL